MFDGRDAQPGPSGSGAAGRSASPVGSLKGDFHGFTDAHAEGPGSVSGAPELPDGFTDTFSSRYVDAGELRLHAVIGGWRGRPCGAAV